MDSQKVISLLSREEGPKLDFKLKLNTDTESSKKELAKDICAIANSRGGRGYILFGVEDKTKRVEGICPEDFGEERIQQVVSTRIDPPVPVSVDIVKLDTKYIGVITIYNTEQKPHQMRENGAFYIRRGSTTDIMRKEELASMLQDNGLVNYELLPVIKADRSHLNEEKIKDYFLKSGLPDTLDNDLMLSIGILVKDRDSSEIYPTYGAMLLFGCRPQDFIPHSGIRIHHADNQQDNYFHISKGTIPDILDDAFDYLLNIIGNSDYPIDVIYELVANAVIHRDYFDINNMTDIYIGKNRIEITNPGSALKALGNNSNAYIRRNSWIYLKLLTIDKEHKYINRNLNINQLIRPWGRIKYYNISSKNIFKALIPITIK